MEWLGADGQIHAQELHGNLNPFAGMAELIGK